MRCARWPLLPSGKFARFAPAVAGLLTALLVLLIVGIRPSPASLLLSNVLQTAVVFWAAYCSFRVARHSCGYLHQLWMLLAVSLSIAGAAKATATYYQGFAPAPSAAPWPSDVLFILWVIPAVMMFLSPSTEKTAEIDWQQILAFAQVGVVGLTAYLYFLYVSLRWEAGEPQMIRRILLAQFVRDAALCAGFLMRTVTTSPRSIRAFFRRMSYLFLAASAADLMYLVGHRAFPSMPNWTDIAWCAPYFFAAVSAATWESGEEPIVPDERSPFRLMITSQILPVCVPLLVLFMGKRIAAEQMTIAWVAITASFVISAERLVLTNEKQRRLADHTEQARRRSENMLSTAFRLSPDAMGIIAIPGGQFLEVNDTFARLTGYTHEETIGRTALEMNLWVDPYRRAKVMAELREESEVREVEFYCRTKSGEMRLFQFSGRVIEQEGQPCALFNVRDITARKKTEEALRASEERFRNLVEDMHVGIVLLGPDTEATFANQAALDMFGLRREQALGNSISLTFTPIREDGTKIPRSMLPGVRAVETKQTIRNQVVGWRRPESNDVLWTLIDAVPQLTDQGEIASVVLSSTNITEMKRAEGALRASGEQTRSLIQEMHVGILLLGPGAETKFANQAALDMFGLTREQAIGNNITQIYFTPIREDGTKLPSSMLPGVRAIETRQTIRNQVVGWRRLESDDVLWTLIGAIPQLNDQGEIASVILSLTNITEMKRAESALRKSEELFRSLVENLHVAVVLLGPDQEIRFANPASFKMFGMKEEQVLGKRVSDLGPTPLNEDGTEMPFSTRPVARAIATRQAALNWVMGYRLPGSNDVLWIQGEAVPLFDKDGELESVIASFSDITQRKQAEEALRKSEELFRTLVENLHVGVVLLGPNQECQYANRASSKMFGLKETQSLGKSTIELGMTPLNEDGTEMPAPMRPVARAIATRHAVLDWVMGWRVPALNDVLWIHGEAVPLLDKNGEVETLVASYSDITKWKQSQEALHQLSTRLLQLQDEERRRIGRELHDVLAQSVMAVNLDLAQVARSSVPLDKQAKRALSEARGVLGEMSREIRTLSYMLHPPVLDELGLASAIQEYATGFCERSGIALELDVQAGFGRLAQEAETALFRIVQESLSNIQRHSGSRTARIRLCGDSDCVDLQVSDQGRGMDQSAVERGSNVGTRLGVGILGMRERMAQLGGKLEVESSSSGTTVRATIPLLIEVGNVASYPRSR
jgi:PAS domain S-box-containing protein